MNDDAETIAIGDGSIVLQLSTRLSTELEEDGTICGFIPDAPDLLALRFSSVTCSAETPDRTAKLDFAAEILAQGNQKGRPIMQVGATSWYYEDQDTRENAEMLWIRFWHGGHRNKRIIVSLTCGYNDRQNLLVQEIIALVPKCLATLKPRAQKTPLTSLETQILNDQRALVQNTLRNKYGTFLMPQLRADLPALQRIVNDRVFSPEQEHEWSCVGVAFGDVIANELGLDWIVQCDVHGTEPALNLSGTSITLFPRPMIMKRVEKGEYPDLACLLGKLEESMLQLKQKGC